MRHFGPVIISKVCDNPTCENVAPASDPSASYTPQSVVTYTGSEMEFTYCSNRCVNEDYDRSSSASEDESHYWDHTMALVEDEERMVGAHMAAFIEDAHRVQVVQVMPSGTVITRAMLDDEIQRTERNKLRPLVYGDRLHIIGLNVSSNMFA